MTVSRQRNRLSVSVIIPTYNRSAFIADAIESALTQKRPADEILVVDDGSTDDTPAILSRFGPPVRVIRQSNRGRSAARNTGLRAVTTDAFIFLDSDDWLVPDCLASCLSVLEQRPEVGVIYTDSLLCDADGNTLAVYSQQLPGNRPCGMVLPELTRRNLPSISSMVRRQFVGDTLFDETMACGEDYDFWRKMSVRCPYWYVDKPLLRYRLHEEMTSSGAVVDMLRAEVEVQRRIFAMPEFRALPRRIQARAFCFHGIKHIVLGKKSEARRCFSEAFRASPVYPAAYALWFASLISPRLLRSAIVKRRQLAGNRLGTSAGLNAVRNGERPQPRAAAPELARTVVHNSTVVS
jgi:glycosyltransferase involved in cell wall biosynthesis